MAESGKDSVAIERAVREFVSSNFLFGRDGDNLDRDESFIALGVLDSTGVLEIVAFVEGKWGIEVADEELGPENLDSVAALVDYVGRKLAARTSAGGTGSGDEETGPPASKS